MKLDAAVFTALMIMSGPTLSHASYLIYSDNFTGAANTPIGGQPVALSTNAGGNGGTANAIWATTGTVNYSPSSNAAFLGGGQADSALLTLAPRGGYIYTLTATITPGGGSAIDLGFGTAGAPNVYIQDTTSSATLFGVPGNTGGISLGAGGVLNDSIVLNTNGTNWQESVVSGLGTTLASFTFAGNPTVTQVGFTSTGASTSSISGFSLTAVPEPSSYVAGLMVVAFLAFEIRRRMVIPKSVTIA